MKNLIVILALLLSASASAFFKDDKDKGSSIKTLTDKVEQLEERVKSLEASAVIVEAPDRDLYIGEAMKNLRETAERHGFYITLNDKLTEVQKVNLTRSLEVCFNRVKEDFPESQYKIMINELRVSRSREASYSMYRDGRDLIYYFNGSQEPTAQECYDEIVAEGLYKID